MWAEGTTGSMDVVADVSGRTLNGECSGTNTDAPTVLLEVGMGGNPDTFNGVQDHLTPLTTFCRYDRAGSAFSDPPVELPRPVTEVVDEHRRIPPAGRPTGAPVRPTSIIGHSFGGELGRILYAAGRTPAGGRPVSWSIGPQCTVADLAGAGAHGGAPRRRWLTYELPYVEGDNDEGVVA